MSREKTSERRRSTKNIQKQEGIGTRKRRGQEQEQDERYVQEGTEKGHARKKKVINFKPRRHHKGEDIRYTRTGRRVCTTRHKKEKGTSYEEE